MKKPTRVEVVCVGTELLMGKVNTHTGYLGEQLPDVGLTIAREHTVGDDPALMKEVFRDAWRRAGVVICAGGLGPTFDDITRDVWSSVVGRKLKTDAALVEDIREKFRRRGIPMPPMNRRQALVLQGADVVPNRFGTAPGQALSIGKKFLILLPGPTRELVPMMETAVLPRLRKMFGGTHIVRRIFYLIGLPESTVDAKIRPIVARYQNVRGCRVVHGILASQSIISVKFSVGGMDLEAVTRVADQIEKKLRTPLREWIFGSDDETLESVVGDLLRAKKKKLALAESCTGGLLAKMLTDRSGASDYFSEGLVTYSDRSKMERLGVKLRTLEKNGAVSESVAREMALGARKTSRADFALSITGIAGPLGGTTKKPVGLVYIGCAGPRRTLVRRFNFDGTREWIRHRSALMALDILRRELI